MSSAIVRVSRATCYHIHARHNGHVCYLLVRCRLLTPAMGRPSPLNAEFRMHPGAMSSGVTPS